MFFIQFFHYFAIQSNSFNSINHTHNKLLFFFVSLMWTTTAFKYLPIKRITWLRFISEKRAKWYFNKYLIEIQLTCSVFPSIGWSASDWATSLDIVAIFFWFFFFPVRLQSKLFFVDKYAANELLFQLNFKIWIVLLFITDKNVFDSCTYPNENVRIIFHESIWVWRRFWWIRARTLNAEVRIYRFIQCSIIATNG